VPLPNQIAEVQRALPPASTAPETIAPIERRQRDTASREAAGESHRMRATDGSLAGARRPDTLERVLSRAVRDRASLRRSGAATLSRVLDEEQLKARGHAITVNPTPSRGANLWLFTNPKTNTKLYIVGTIHSSNVIRRMEQGLELLEFMTTSKFDAVYAEIEERFAKPLFNIQADVVNNLRDARKLRTKYPSKPQLSETALMAIPGTLGLDNLLVAAATNWAGCSGLETHQDRKEVRDEYTAAAGKNTVENRLDDYEAMEDYYAVGDEVRLNATHAEWLFEGKDLQDIESRNQRWVGSMSPDYHPGQTVLWIVGVSHLGGLRVELSKRGWVASPVDLKAASSSSNVATTGVDAVPVGSGINDVD
jgi:hypothetical protein